MPRNGSGIYSPPSSPGSFNPAIAGQSATPTDWNALLADIATALTASIASDGQTAITADIPFGNHKITGLAAGTATTDAVNAGQLVGNSFSGANDTGTADAYAIAPSIAISSYAAYQGFQFKALNTNTGASTLAVSALAAKTIKHLDGTDLLAGDIVAGAIIDVMYDGTNFQLLSSIGLRGTASTWRAAQTFNAATIMAATAKMNAAAFNGATRVNVASGGTADIGSAASNYVRITGATTINSLGPCSSGIWRFVYFAGAMTLTASADITLPNGGGNITTATGDTAIFIGDLTDTWRCISYQRVDGTPLQSGYTPPQSAYFYGTFSGGVLTQRKASGMTVSRTGNGTLTCTLSPAMPDAYYRVLAMTASTLNGGSEQGEWVSENSAGGSRTTSTFYLRTRGDNIDVQDPDAISIQVFA